MEGMKAEQLRHQVRRLLRNRGLLDNLYGQSGLTTIQCHALIEIDALPTTLPDLSVALNVDTNNASQTLAILINQGLVEQLPEQESGTVPAYTLTDSGREKLNEHHRQMNGEITEYVAQMDDDEIHFLLHTLDRYNRAMEKVPLQLGYTLRPIEPIDNPGIAAVIRAATREYGLTDGQGFSAIDPALDSLSETYRPEGAGYWVIEKNLKILGGAGIAPLEGKPEIAELQKLYLRPECRSLGLGRRLAVTALKFAREHGYRACYAETTQALPVARAMFLSLGFEELNSPVGNTGHTECELRFIKTFHPETNKATG
ncbi:helix-turn-helix domain-containing GNAT family N-acetyltransferase [Parasalinivibrio latis]|uniref:bifunctional helix-turn-helix transcriptional regulator/GNAT family N-acetyltransferase n=1 Tax=Parasalinivibrio latis TaxID=2952610 RepID=UPI0030E5294C